ncbi:MAG: DNA mismatch repair protein MutS [Oscillospiraceae bacterium]
MMNLSRQLREETGYEWVMDRLSPITPFGKAMARSAKWYGPEEETALEAELDRVTVAAALPVRSTDFVVHAMSMIQDISGSLDRREGSVMDDVELFLLKSFLLTLERLVEAYDKLHAPFEGIHFLPMSRVLDILDPTQRRLGAFTTSEFDPLILNVDRREAEEREQAVRRKLTAALMPYKDTFFENFDTIGHLDLVLAKGRLAQRFHCVRPVLSADRVEAEEMVHPQIAALVAEKGRDFTPLSLSIPKGCTVITGANMGGKSISLETLSLNVLLTQTGFFVFADKFEAPLFDRMTFLKADGQSAQQGLSSFGAEMTAVDALLKEGRGTRFFLALDEFARGTNPQEGAALAKALAHYLNTLDCVALMTTHYDGVSDVAACHYQVAGLDENAPGETLSEKMDYHLIPAVTGAPCPRDARKVCRLLKLTPELLEIFGESD